MLGAIIGDLAGSIYEFDQMKKHKNVSIKNIIEENSFFSDDTILTISIADAVLNKKDYGATLKKYALKYWNKIPKGIEYFKTMFSPGFTAWARSKEQGRSSGNGAMMRISPIGFLFNKEEEVIKNSYLATIPSHNSEEAINCAKTISLIIFYSRQGFTKKEIIEKLNLTIKKPVVENLILHARTQLIYAYTRFLKQILLKKAYDLQYTLAETLTQMLALWEVWQRQCMR